MLRTYTWLVMASLAAASLGSAPARCEEPVESFLEALRQREYYDAALLYLERMDGSPLIPPSFQERLRYERGLTLIQAAGVERDPVVREDKLQKARSNLEAFVEQQPDHAEAVAARRQLGQLLKAWANIKLDDAERQGRDELRQEAAQLYQQSYETFTAGKARLKDLLLNLRKQTGARATAEQTERRDRLRGEYLEVQVLAGQALEEKADAVDPDSPQRNKLLEQAANVYAEIFDKYSEDRLLAAYFARLYQARTLMKLGKQDEALQMLVDDLLTMDENKPRFRDLKTSAMLLAVDAWMRDPKDGKAYAQAVKMGSAWLASVRPAETREPDWIQLRLELARLAKAYADLLKARNPRDQQVKELLEEATEWARFAARAPSTYQDEARALLAELPGGIRAIRPADKPDPKTFEEARRAGKQAMDSIASARFILEKVPPRLEKEQDPDERKELETTLREARQSVQQAQEDAVQYFTQALRLANSETLLEDLSYVTYCLAYLNFLRGEYYDAVVLGEFFSRRHPDVLLASKSAEIALGALLKLYEENESDDKQFETERVIGLSLFMVETWAGKPEAATAINTLIPFLIRQGRIDEARQYVQEIPVQAPERGPAELRVGQALWQQYTAGIAALRAGEETAAQPDAATGTGAAEKIQRRRSELEQLKQTALQTLEAGVQRVQKTGNLDLSGVLAVLTLIQIYGESDQPGKALALLDDERIGPMTLIARRDAVMADPRLVEQAYRLTLDALIGALPKAADAAARDALLQRARQTMQALKEEVGESAAGQRRLVGIFFSMARDLREQLASLPDPGDRRVLSEGFATFLEEVRSQTDDIRVLNWVAQSYVDLGNGVRADDDTGSAGKPYYDKAVATYDAILRDQDLKPALQRQLTVSKAIALRQAGQYEASVRLFEQVLAEDTLKVPIQVEAARTLQQWGVERGQAERYREAVQGRPRGSRDADLWGWKKLARLTQPNSKFRDTFHEARYNMAFCYFKYGMRQTDSAQREKYLDLASKTITYTAQFFPEMGGSARRDAYSALLRQIQKALGERPVGLPARPAKRTK